MPDLEGLEEVFARLDAAVAVMRGPAASLTVKRVAEQAAESMRSAAPVLTGELRGSVQVRPANEGDIVAEEIEVGSHHAAFVEFGTSDMKAQPFYRPAMHAAENDLPMVAKETYRATVPGLTL